MLFNSYIFWIFFAIVIVLYRQLKHKHQNILLLIASYTFYGYWDWRFLSLILISTVVDYFVSLKITKSDDKKLKKRLILISVFTNLGLLGVFKYYGFFITEFLSISEAIGFSFSLPVWNIVLPVGISFYTFQTMSYTIDVYRGNATPTDRFFDFALYVSFFPQLVAGPIERPKRLLPQILNPRTIGNDNFSIGLYHVLIGMFKKIVIADNMAPIVNLVFGMEPSDISGTEVMIGIYAFALQVYGDFSGYSSIAQGIAKWFGVDLMWNFKMPFFASSPNEFWEKWHISLSTWLRDYLFIPLGGSRGGNFFIYRNLMLTMILGGIWHGAGRNYVVWGVFHGLILVIYRIIEDVRGKRISKLETFTFSRILKIILFFHIFAPHWIIFRSPTLTQSWTMFGKIVTDFHLTELSIYGFSMLLFLAAPIMILEIWIEHKKDMLAVVNGNWIVRSIVYLYFIFMLLFFPPLSSQQFIYFQF